MTTATVKELLEIRELISNGATIVSADGSKAVSVPKELKQSLEQSLAIARGEAYLMRWESFEKAPEDMTEIILSIPISWEEKGDFIGTGNHIGAYRRMFHGVHWENRLDQWIENRAPTHFATFNGSPEIPTPQEQTCEHDFVQTDYRSGVTEWDCKKCGYRETQRPQEQTKGGE